MFSVFCLYSRFLKLELFLKSLACQILDVNCYFQKLYHFIKH